jgi:hypothetical protein
VKFIAILSEQDVMAARQAILDRYYAGGKVIQMTPVKPVELVAVVARALGFAMPEDPEE